MFYEAPEPIPVVEFEVIDEEEVSENITDKGEGNLKKKPEEKTKINKEPKEPEVKKSDKEDKINPEQSGDGQTSLF